MDLAARVAARYKKKKVLDTGTVVYEYSPQQVARRNSQKAERLEALRKNIHKLEAQVKKDLESGDPEKVLTALAVGLMRATHERVGNEESASEGHVGVTGWSKSHVKFSRGKATISYVGKSGVKQKKVISDKALVSKLKDAYEACEDDIFCHDTGTVDAKKVNAYLKKFDITAKDLRGFGANSVMKEKLEALRKGELPTDPKERKAQLEEGFQKALEETAEAVGHEASTLRSQYLVPDLEAEYMKGRVMTRMVKTASRVARPFGAGSHMTKALRYARAIRLDKRGVDELAKLLEQYLSRNVPKGPWGNRTLNPRGYPHTIRAVDGSTMVVQVLLKARESDSPYYVLDGGSGHAKGQPVVVIHLNGSLEIPKNTGGVLKTQLYPVLLHELTHAADKYTRGGLGMSLDEARGNEDYYNDPGEVRAYMQEVVDEVMRHSRHFDTFFRKFGPSRGLEYLLKFSATWTEASPYWTEVNRRKVIKAVSQAIAESPSEVRSSIATRVADEVLTKQWVMGIRRTWLKLMKPKIRTWADVQRAIDQCRAFVRNLRDEVFYTRRGPYTGTPTMTEGGKVDKLLKTLESEFLDARSRAKFFEDVSKGVGLPGGQFTAEQAEQSLRAWGNDFEDSLSAGIQGSLTTVLDKVLKLLREDAKRISEHDDFADAHGLDRHQPNNAFKQFDLNGVKVIVDDSKASAADIRYYIKLLDRAHQLLKKKGFGKVWYGEVFIQCEKCGGDNPYGAELGVGGHYRTGPDTISIFERPSKSVTELVVHELGHRWWFKHMKRENRLRFEDWISAGLVPVSVYGGKHHHEAFAEAFAWYTLGKSMTPQQVETFKQVAFDRRYSASEVATRVSTRYRLAKVQEVNEAFVEALRKDVLTLTKNVPRIKQEADFEKLRRGLVVWRKYFNSVIYERWLNVLPRYIDHRLKYHLDKVRKVAWDLYIDMEVTNIDWWDQRKLKLWSQRVQKKARDLWKLLRDVVSEYNRYFRSRGQGDELQTEVESQERYSIAGFDVLVKGFSEGSSPNHKMMGGILEAFKTYRQRASQFIPLLIKMQRPMVLDFNAGLDKGGSYFSYDRGVIMINPAVTLGKLDVKGGVKTLAHEMGHHVWSAYLSSGAKEAWEATIYGDFGALDLEKLLQKWPDSLRWVTDFTDYMRSKNSILTLQVEAIYNQNNSLDRREDFVALLEQGTKKLNVPKTPITGYASKNPEEAFCEAIGLLVAYGPRAVHEKVRYWLETVFPGQIKTAGRQRQRHKVL